jgi:hypothetical protein
VEVVIVQEQIMDSLHKIVRLLMHINIASTLALLAWLAMASQSGNASVNTPYFGHESGSARTGSDR